MLCDIAEEYVSIARKAFQWLAFSERPLQLNELAEAAILGLLGSLNVEDRLTSPYDVVDICSNLVAVTPSGAIDETETKIQIAFSHITVKEYLLTESARSARAARFSISDIKAQTLLCHACLSYLITSMREDTSTVETQKSLPLLSYTMQFWYQHVVTLREKDGLPSSIVALAVELFDTKRIKSILRGNHNPVMETPEGLDAVSSNTSNFPTSLYYASILGLDEVVSLLIQRGDRLDEVGGYCGSPLHAAAFNGHVGSVHLLMEHGADVNLTAGYFGSVLQIASYGGHAEIIHLLLELGADVNLESGYYGSALQAAVAAGHKEVVELLIEYGADINAQGGAFGNALSASAEGAHVEVVQTLLENGANLDAHGDLETRSALYHAAAQGHSQVVRLLLDAGAGFNTRRLDNRSVYDHDSQTESPFIAAARGGHVEVVQLLMRSGHDGGPEKILALHEATLHDHSSVVEVLLKVGGYIVNSKDEKGCSPWMKAASRGHIKTIHVLEQADAQTNATDNHGNTALMMAIEGGHKAMVRYLLLNGAETDAKNSAGKTAMDIAIAKNDHDMVALLTKMDELGIFEKESMLDNDNRSDYNDVMDHTEDLSIPESPKQRLQIELTIEQTRNLVAELRKDKKSETDMRGKNSSVSVASSSDPTKVTGTRTKDINDILNILQKRLDTSISIKSPKLKTTSSRSLQRSSTFGLDMEHDSTKRIPLSTLQRRFTWESDDDDVNDDTRKESRPR